MKYKSLKNYYKISLMKNKLYNLLMKNVNFKKNYLENLSKFYKKF